MNTMNAFSRVSALIAALIFLAGCDPVTDPGTGNSTGTGPFEGVWNEAVWNGRGYVVLVNDTLYVTGHRRPIPTQFYDERASVKVRFTGVGKYILTGGEAELWEITGGDAGYFAGVTGEMEITRFDHVTMEIEGHLDLGGYGYGRQWSLTGVNFKLPIYTNFNEPPPLY